MSKPGANSDRSQLESLATSLVRSERSGVLSTLSASHEGWPFGSVVPYAIGRDGSFVLVLSDLAEHTRNARADARASLFVQESAMANKPQSGARIAVLGRVARLDGDAEVDARAFYEARHPEGGAYLDKLDFHVYVLSPEHVRLIAGFGHMGWLEGSVLRLDASADPLVAHVRDICEHMNADHADVLRNACAAFRNRADAKPTMTAIDQFGFDVVDETSRDRLRFDFESRVTSPDEARRALVGIARSARTKLGP